MHIGYGMQCWLYRWSKHTKIKNSPKYTVKWTKSKNLYYDIPFIGLNHRESDREADHDNITNFQEKGAIKSGFPINSNKPP